MSTERLTTARAALAAAIDEYTQAFIEDDPPPRPELPRYLGDWALIAAVEPLDPGVATSYVSAVPNDCLAEHRYLGLLEVAHDFEHGTPDTDD